MRRHVYYYTHVQAPYEELAARLGEDPIRWLPDPVEVDGPGWRIELVADGVVPQAVASRRAHVEVGPATHPGPRRLLRAVTWRADSAEALAPVMDADLEIAALPGHGCQLSFMGTYRPPMSVIGQAGDRLLGHRVAEACVRRFVLDIGEQLEARLRM